VGCRRYLEQIGYWGSPGTPSPNVTGPIPIVPFSYPTLPGTEVAYEQAYPQGMEAPYKWYSQAQIQTLIDEAQKNKGSGTTPSRHLDIISLLIGAVAATIVCLVLDSCYSGPRFWIRTSGYQRIE
jgi:hypothetical protein